MTNAEKLARIDALLKDIPSFDCKPGCADCCGPIEMSRLEYHRCVKASGKTMQALKETMQRNLKRGDYRCVLLNPKTNQCTVYTARPAICRLFGVVNVAALHCPHGCAPESSALLSDARSREILALVNELGR